MNINNMLKIKDSFEYLCLTCSDTGLPNNIYLDCLGVDRVKNKYIRHKSNIRRVIIRVENNNKYYPIYVLFSSYDNFKTLLHEIRVPKKLSRYMFGNPVPLVSSELDWKLSFWIDCNSDLLFKHWNHQISDLELVNSVYKVPAK